MAVTEKRKVFNPAEMERDQVVGWVPEGYMIPTGQGRPARKVTANDGEALTVNKLTDADGKIDPKLIEEHEAHIKLDVAWITPASMGEPYSGTDAKAMLTAYAEENRQDEDNLVMQLILQARCTDIYNRSMAKCKPRSEKQIDRHTEVLMAAVGSGIEGWADMTTEERSKKLAEWLLTRSKG